MSEKGIIFNYFYGIESDAFQFFRVPKLLIDDDYFKNLSSDAKILYGLMLDRMSLSRKNGWFDEDNKVYIYFTVEDVMDLLHVGKNKAIHLLMDLDDEKGIGLIERINQGQGNPARIYVKNFIQRTEISVTESKDQTSRGLKTKLQEVSKSNFKEFQNQTSRSLKTKLQEVSKSNPNNTNINQTNINQTNINQTKSNQSIDQIREDMWKKLDYDYLIKNNPFEKELLEGILDIIVETMASMRDVIQVGKEKYTKAYVVDKFKRLGSDHIQYVVRCLIESQNVRNVRQYILTALFNAPSTISEYYQIMVNENMPKG